MQHNPPNQEDPKIIRRWNDNEGKEYVQDDQARVYDAEKLDKARREDKPLNEAYVGDVLNG